MLGEGLADADADADAARCWPGVLAAVRVRASWPRQSARLQMPGCLGWGRGLKSGPALEYLLHLCLPIRPGAASRLSLLVCCQVGWAPSTAWVVMSL